MRVANVREPARTRTRIVSGGGAGRLFAAGHAGSYASERVGEQRRLELGRLASGLAPGLAPGLVPGLVPSPAASLQAAEMLAGGKPRRKKRRHVITANLSGTRYDISTSRFLAERPATRNEFRIRQRVRCQPTQAQFTTMLQLIMRA